MQIKGIHTNSLLLEKACQQRMLHSRNRYCIQISKPKITCWRNFLWSIKNFDCVNHEILLTKLHFYGIQGVTIDCFWSYLTNRRQKVEIKSLSSSEKFFPDWGILKHGVPQGSILGPLLFLVYINDLPPRINSLAKPILFADDTSVIICNGNFRNFSATSNLVLSRMIEWFAANKLILNLEKKIYNESCNKEYATLCIDHWL
jgi:hypothetical protein